MGRLSVVYVIEKSRLEVAEHVEAELVLLERKLHIHLCQLGMLLGNIRLCVCMCACVRVLGH